MDIDWDALQNFADVISSDVQTNPDVSSSSSSKPIAEANAQLSISPLYQLLTSGPAVSCHGQSSKCTSSHRAQPYRISSHSPPCDRCQALGNAVYTLHLDTVLFNPQKLSRSSFQLQCLQHYLSTQLDGTCQMEYLITPQCCRGNLLLKSSVYHPELVLRHLITYLASRKIIQKNQK